MHHLELVASLAVFTIIWLENTTARDEFLFSEAALTPEIGLFHFGDDI